MRARPLRQIHATEALARVREMRQAPTEGEALLWSRLRARRCESAKFRRQVWIGPYIADFVCMEARLIIELDGSQHADQAEYDAARDTCLQAQGFRVLRFWNNDLIENLDGVLEAVRAALRAPSPSHAARGPLPLPPGEGK